MHRALPPLLALLAALVLHGCRTAPGPSQPPGPETKAVGSPAPPAVAAAPEIPLLALPATWREMSDLAFERVLDIWLPPGEARALASDDLAALGAALASGDSVSVRAAVILGRSRYRPAGDILLARLEKRAVPPANQSERNAADVVAAAAFTQGATAGNGVGRLASLAEGRRPHPDIFVRVECARSALFHGRDDGIPLLLNVLRLGTNAGRPLLPAERIEDIAWLQMRAAEALSARAATERRFRPEASVKEREEETARLAALLPRPPEKKR